jgi:hypothetical protein
MGTVSCTSGQALLKLTPIEKNIDASDVHQSNDNNGHHKEGVAGLEDIE